MPIYGRQKHLEMARSLLPSKNRKTARKAKTALHRKNRRFVDSNLNTYRGYASDLIEDYYDDEFHHTFNAEPHRSDFGRSYGNDIVYERRLGDKLAHFEVWAYHKTKHLRPEDRMSYLRSIIPGMMGSFHAMSHVERWMNPNHPYYIGRPERFDGLPPQIENSRRNNTHSEVRDYLIAKLNEFENDYEISQFNKFILPLQTVDVYEYLEIVLLRDYDDPFNKYVHRSVVKKIEFKGVRLLHDKADIESFVDDLLNSFYRINSYGNKHPMQNPAFAGLDPWNYRKAKIHPSWMNSVAKFFNIKVYRTFWGGTYYQTPDE